MTYIESTGSMQTYPENKLAWFRNVLPEPFGFRSKLESRIGRIYVSFQYKKCNNQGLLHLHTSHGMRKFAKSQPLSLCRRDSSTSGFFQQRNTPMRRNWKHREYLGNTERDYSIQQATSWKQVINRKRLSWSLQKVMASVFETAANCAFWGSAVSRTPIEVDTSSERRTRYGIKSQWKEIFQQTFSKE